MYIFIETVDHDKQRYPTVGDWQINDNKDTIHIKVSKLGNFKQECLIGIHELLECLLCLDRGITEDEVTTFDVEYERRRSEKDIELFEEPGDNPHAPYRLEHFFATSIERLIAAELNINWQEYEKHINDL